MSVEAQGLHDVYVVSDLHLGRGKNPESGRYFSLEAFFYDDDLRRFARYLVDEARERGVPFKLIFNGDVFDLLRIDPDDEPHPDATRRERRFGAALTPATAARLVGDVLQGHPLFVEAVAHVLTSGFEVVFLPGNHDIELQWRPVQDVVRRFLVEDARARAGETAANMADERLHFAPWFHHEPGRLWVEHGCQYDGESAFRSPLRSKMLEEDAAGAAAKAEADLPLGSFIQRYLFNAFGPITFIVPSTRANFRYVKWLLVNRPRLLARVMLSHAPFAVQLLRRLSLDPQNLRGQLAREHDAELRQIADATGLGEKLIAIDALRDTSHDLVRAARSLTWQLVKFVGIGTLVAVTAAGLWFTGFATINELHVGLGPKALLFLLLNFLMLLTAVSAAGYAMYRGQSTTPAAPLCRAATRIAEILDVPIVTFGHTHDEALWRLDVKNRRAWYYNTGTWIAVFTHEDLMPRERVQFTFLRVRGHSGELLQWSPGRNTPLPVILLDEEIRGGQSIRVSGADPAP